VKARRVIAVLLFALIVYFVLIGIRGVFLLTQPKWDLKVLGGAVLALPLVGIWVVVAELRFGQATQRLADALDEDDDPAVPELPRTPSGRVDRRAADAVFDVRRAEVEADPDNWQRWYRLALAYDAAGDRRRAREAMRDAIEKAGPVASR
jgi:hypothetical protein